jgi:murein DD-endopeptidase MepM/ murein hydrolase activator NlpD
VLAFLLALAVSAAAPAHRAAPTHLVWPAQGTITTPFVPGGHPGIDIGILSSRTIRAAATGRVKLVGERRGYEGYGKVVLVDVGGGYSNLYAHLSRYRVQVGEEVYADQPIAVAGCTGWCTGTHLHFELRLHGRPVNPMQIPLGPNSARPRAVGTVGRAPARQADRAQLPNRRLESAFSELDWVMKS